MPKNWEWVSELRRAPTEHRVTLSIGHSYFFSFDIGFSLIISPGGEVSSLSPQISLFHALMWHLPFSQLLDIQHPLSTPNQQSWGLVSSFTNSCSTRTCAGSPPPRLVQPFYISQEVRSRAAHSAANVFSLRTEGCGRRPRQKRRQERGD